MGVKVKGLDYSLFVDSNRDDERNAPFESKYVTHNIGFYTVLISTLLIAR